MNRRSVLQFLGAVPVMGRGLESKLKHDLMSGRLSSIQGVSGLMEAPQGEWKSLEKPGSPISSSPISNSFAMQLPWFRDELRSLLCERHRYVPMLDPDLAVLRSVSLSAKIYYQRQRNVDRSMVSMTSDPTWVRINNLWSKVRGLIGG